VTAIIHLVLGGDDDAPRLYEVRAEGETADEIERAAVAKAAEQGLAPACPGTPAWYFAYQRAALVLEG
jgi:hypothetical protein